MIGKIGRFGIWKWEPNNRTGNLECLFHETLDSTTHNPPSTMQSPNAELQSPRFHEKPGLLCYINIKRKTIEVPSKIQQRGISDDFYEPTE